MIVIREAQEADAMEMARVIVDTWLAAHRGQVDEEQWQKRRDEWTYDVSAQGWARTLRAKANGASPNDVVYLAITSDNGGRDQIVALATGGPSRVPVWEDAAEIYSLYVLPDYQRQGIGKRLLRAATSQLSAFGMNSLIIRVLDTNTPAIAFYESFGGELAGEVSEEDYGFQILERIYAWRAIGQLIQNTAQ